MILKKLFVILLLLVITAWKSLAYTSDELIVLHVVDPVTRTSVYIVPEWKDLLIHDIYINDINENIYIRNSTETTDLLHLLLRTDNPDINLIVKDDLQILADPWTNVHITIRATLVTEWQDIRYITDHLEDGINKPIFDDYSIQEIFLYEWIIMLFIVLFTFFARLLWYKKKRPNKYL